MSFLAPSAFAWVALAFPILILYMLKMRRRELIVSSTFLWRRVVEDRQANTPWQRIQRNLLLFLQLGILVLIIVALARPVLARPAAATGSVILLLDGSASMLASDVSPNRFEAAVAEAQTLVDTLRPGHSMTIILASATPEIIAAAETDRTVLGQALNNAKAALAEADWPAALSLAAGAYQSAGPETTTIILSDGGLGSDTLPGFPGDVQFLPVGKSGENVGITAMSARSAGGVAHLMTRISNYGRKGQSVLLSIYRDGELVRARRYFVPGGESNTTFLSEFPDEAAEFTARLSAPGADAALEDWLEFDNQGFAVHKGPQQGKVLLVSTGNLFLEQLLAASRGITAYRALPEDLETRPVAELSAFDLIIYDRTFTGPTLAANSLIIAPPDGILFRVLGEFQPDPADVRVLDHPLTRFVDWGQVHISSAAIVQRPEWAEILVTASQGPLVFAGRPGQQRVAVLTFDLLESDLVLQTAFPILIANLMDYLLPGLLADLPGTLAPGADLSSLPFDALESATLESPTGEMIWQAGSAAIGQVIAIDQTGFYTLNYRSGDEIASISIAVNQFSSEEGKIQPAAEILLGQHAITPQTPGEGGQQEVWWWFAFGALLLLVFEWWVYHRGITDWRDWGRLARSR